MVAATMSSTGSHEWHIRWQRPDAKTRLLSFIDANADRITYRQFFQLLEKNEHFLAVFLAALGDCDLRTFVWETPSVDKRSLVNEFECALTELPVPAKTKVHPAKFADQFREDELVVAFPTPEGEGQIVVPCPRQAEGWYADLTTFMRRVQPAQVQALWQTVGRLTNEMLATQRVRVRSSALGAPWLHFIVGPSPKPAAYRGYSAP